MKVGIWAAILHRCAEHESNAYVTALISGFLCFTALANIYAHQRLAVPETGARRVQEQESCRNKTVENKSCPNGEVTLKIIIVLLSQRKAGTCQRLDVMKMSKHAPRNSRVFSVAFPWFWCLYMMPNSIQLINLAGNYNGEIQRVELASTNKCKATVQCYCKQTVNYPFKRQPKGCFLVSSMVSGVLSALATTTGFLLNFLGLLEQGKDLANQKDIWINI